MKSVLIVIVKSVVLLVFLISNISCKKHTDLVVCEQYNDSKKLNVILIIADDLGYEDMKLYASNGLSLPGIEALAADGIQYKRGYVTASVCAPSRAGLLTGRNQQTFGFVRNIIDPIRNSYPISVLGLPQGQQTIASYLKSYGYNTGLIGKWHLGEDINTKHPSFFGFDYFFGILGGSTDYGNHYTEGLIGDPIGNIGNKYYKKLYQNFDEVNSNVYLTDLLTSQAKKFINSSCGDPFFLTLSYTSPHTPFQILAEDLGENDNSIYHAMIRNLDQNISSLLDYLKEKSEYDNTMILFISDNGCSVNAECIVNRLRGNKGTIYEGGIRVPFVYKPPSWVGIGSQIKDKMVSSLDIFPTIINLIDGQQVSGLDGEVLETKGTLNDEDRVLYFDQAIIKGDWKLILPDELYLLSEDISEEQNKIDVEIEKKDELMKLHNQWKSGLPEALW